MADREDASRAREGAATEAETGGEVMRSLFLQSGEAKGKGKGKKRSAEEAELKVKDLE